MRRLLTRWMYWLARCDLRSSLRCASATYSGLLPTIRPFISVTALVASSGAEKQTNPKPFERPSSSITLAEVMVPYGANSLRSRSSSIVSSRFFTYRLTPW
uniref:Putative secreted protein n=1 Tax=Anopheles triannulatus TaxID=58253 RepID=A0A2M4B0J5_9DIPT